MCIAATNGMAPYLDQNGKLQCKRRLPSPPPKSLIPEHILELHKKHSEGRLGDDLPRSKLYDVRKLLRRYHLLPSKARRVYVGKSSEERRELRREYLRQRRRQASM